MKDTYFIDTSNAEERALFLSEFSKMRGMVCITVQPKKRMRTSAQRRLYFSVYVRAYQRYFAEQGQVFSAALVHLLLKRKFLKQDIFDNRTGEVIGEEVRSIADGGDVDVKEMGEYLDNCHDFLVNDLRMDLPRLGGLPEAEPQRVNVRRVDQRLLPAGVH